MSAVTTKRASRIVFQAPFVLLEACSHLQGIWGEVLRVGHEFGPQWGIEGLPKTFELESRSVSPTGEDEGLRSRAYFFWAGGNAGRIELEGHTSHFGTHWDKVGGVTLWWKHKEGRKDTKVRWDLSGKAIRALTQASYFRARTGEGQDYSPETSPLKEVEAKVAEVVNEELRELRSRYV